MMKSTAIPPKKEVRKEAKKRRDSLLTEYRKQAEDKIRKCLYGTEIWKKAKNVLVYVSFGSEVSTKEIVEQCYREGKKVCFPRMEGETISFYSIEKREKLVLHPYGIWEPSGDGRKVIPGENDLILVPGLLFSKAGFRLGYGGGFYDRYLEMCPKSTAFGLAYTCQISDEFPVEPWDRPLSGLITEDEIMFFHNRS